MSLFVGNISKNVRLSQLEEEFNKFGRCSIKPKGSYAFIEYDDERGAEDAIRELQKLNMGGLEIVIQWSRHSGKYDPASDTRPPSRRDANSKCYNCDKPGHFARECRSRRRSRSPGDRRRNDSRERSPRGERRDDHRHRRSPVRRDFDRRGGDRHDDRRDIGRRYERRSRSRDRFERDARYSPRRDRRDDRMERRRSPFEDRGRDVLRKKSRSISPRRIVEDRDSRSPRSLPRRDDPENGFKDHYDKEPRHDEREIPESGNHDE